MTRRQPLLIAGCLLGSMGVGASAVQAQNGVAYAGDMQSIDRAMLDVADLSLPTMASGPSLAPRTAPQGNMVQGGVVQAGAPMPVMGVPNQVTPAGFGSDVRPSTVDPADQAKPGLFSKLKPNWLFGKEEAKQPAVDPFAQATQDARIQTVGAATRSFNRNEGTQQIPSYVASQSNNQAAASQQRMQPSQAQRTPNKQGLLSGLWGSGDSTSQQPQQRQPQRTMAQPLFGGKPAVAQQSMPAPTRTAMNGNAKSNSASERPLPSPSYLTNDVQYYAPGPKAAAKTPAAPQGGVVMVSDEPAPTAKRSPIAQVSPAKPMVASTGGAASQPAAVNLSKSPSTAKTLENQFATTKPAKLEEEPANGAVFASDQTPTVVSASPRTPAPVVTTNPNATAEPTPPNPTAAPVVVSLPPRPMPAPLPTNPSAQAMAPVSQAPATYANTATSRPAPVAQEPTSAAATDRAKSLLTEAHQLAATADTPDEFSAVIKRCSYVLAIDNSQEAVGYASQLSGWALAKRGEAFENEGRMNEAEADYLDALRSDPECWRAEHALGVIAARNGNAEEAGRRFNRTLLLNPEFAKAYSNRAALAVQRGDFEAALNDYQQAIEIDPDFEPAHTGRGRVCHMLGRLDEGLQHLDAAELLAPEDGMIATGRGDLLVDLGRYGQAKQAYERAIALDPQNPAAYRNLAWMQATCPVAEFRDGAAAVTNAERAEQLAGGADDLTLDTKAAALAAAGRFEEAAQVQQQAIAGAPESDAAAYRERLALYQQGASFTSQPVAVRQATYMK